MAATTAVAEDKDCYVVLVVVVLIVSLIVLLIVVWLVRKRKREGRFPPLVNCLSTEGKGGFHQEQAGKTAATTAVAEHTEQNNATNRTKTWAVSATCKWW